MDAYQKARDFIQAQLATQTLPAIQEQLRILKKIDIHSLPVNEWDTYRISITEFQKAITARTAR